MQIKIKKLSPDAITPTYATDGSGCFDLYSTIDCEVSEVNSPTIDTGIAFEIPEGHVMLLFSRSGHGFKNAVNLATAVSVIDSDFRGPLQIKLRAKEGGHLKVNKADRIAQALIIPYEKIDFIEVDELESTSRGEKGFGSSGS